MAVSPRNMAESTPNYLTNSDLFSNHYLTDHLPDTEVWESVDEDELERVYREIAGLYDRRKDSVEQYNESMLEQRFIRPVFDILGIDYGVEEEVQNTRRRPDYGFFKSDEAVDQAFERTREGGDFYDDAVAVADAKYWGRTLDSQGDDRHTVENPSFQISVYLDETPAEWAVLTNGKHWRIYYARTSKRLDSYYEIDLPALLDICDPEVDGGLEPFKHFYLLFRHEAFVADQRGCFLERVREESNIFAQELGEDLKDNIYDAIGVLAEGFLTNDDNDLTEDDLQDIHDASLIYLYRIIFVLYAESEGRDLLDTNNEYYRERYSLNTLKQDVAEKRDDPTYEYPTWEDDLWERLNDLFELIDKGSEAKGIPEDELYIPAYNGGLFRTEPGEDDTAEAHFLSENRVDDRHLAEVIDLLTRSEAGSNGEGLTFVDYSSLGIRHLGSIYEGLLEYRLNVADEPLSVDDGEYTPVGEGDEPVVEEGDVYLTTDSGERKATGSYYTPDYVVEYIVENTLNPLLTDIRTELLEEHQQSFADEFAERVFDLKILDPAMGSGHFLTEVVDYLAREIIDAQQKQAERQDDAAIDPSHDINWARRQVAQKCIYGVDTNQMAVELAKVSLWLRTLAAEQPLAFLDHHLKAGDSLVGSNIEEIEGLESGVEEEAGPNASLTQFGVTQKGTIEQLMDVYQEFIAIENRDRTDTKEMERRYREIEQDVVRNRLVAMANVHTAEGFGVDVPGGAYQQMAAAINDDVEWERVKQNDWFITAQELAEEHDFHHWRLEFPEVFYDVEGDLKADPGFDAVVGNPPYVRVQRIGSDTADWLFDEYQTCAKKVDLSVPFLELAVDLITSEGLAGYISTSQWTATDYGEGARKFLGEGHISKMVDFGSLPVFEGISTYPAIFILTDDEQEVLEYVEVESEDRLDLDSLRQLDPRRFGYDRFGTESWVLEGLDLRSVLQQNDATVSISEWGDAKYGAVTGMDKVFSVTDDEIAEHDLEEDLLFPHAHRGDEISRYGNVTPEEKVIYPYEEDNDGSAALISEHRLDQEYPNVHAYLKASKDDLKTRKDSREYYADGPDWYQFARPGRYDYIHTEKLLAQGLTEEACMGLLGEGTIFSGNNCPAFVPADDIPVDMTYLLGLLNSTLISEYLQQICPAKMQGYIRLNAADLASIPVRRVSFETPVDKREALSSKGFDQYEEFVRGNADLDEFCCFVEDQLDQNRADVVHDLLSSIVEEMNGFVEEREALNLNLGDYLGHYDDGEKLADIQGSQPAVGVGDTLLVETADEYPGLRLDDLLVDDEDNGLLVSAKVRYKPDDEDEYEAGKWEEPDRYGYVRTREPIPVIKIRTDDDEARALVREFVELVNEQDDGFAGFYEQATKTISPLSRIEELTLPKLDDVRSGLERYREQHQRDKELAEKMEQTEEAIDQTVYRLYGLTGEEIQTVETASDGE